MPVWYYYGPCLPPPPLFGNHCYCLHPLVENPEWSPEYLCLCLHRKRSWVMEMCRSHHLVFTLCTCLSVKTSESFTMNQFPKVCYIYSTCGHYGCMLLWYHYLASTEQIDKAKEVIKKLTFEFQSDSFENPGTQETQEVYKQGKITRASTRFNAWNSGKRCKLKVQVPWSGLGE